VGVSWAIPLDIGGNYAGSVAAVMNTCGNLGGATASVATGYVVKLYGWNAAFLVMAALCGVAAILHLWIRADRPMALP
jgi:sugar phosphate permease